MTGGKLKTPDLNFFEINNRLLTNDGFRFYYKRLWSKSRKFCRKKNLFLVCGFQIDI